MSQSTLSDHSALFEKKMMETRERLLESGDFYYLSPPSVLGELVWFRQGNANLLVAKSVAAEVQKRVQEAKMISASKSSPAPPPSGRTVHGRQVRRTELLLDELRRLGRSLKVRRDSVRHQADLSWGSTRHVPL
jgi:hypothetical protein